MYVLFAILALVFATTAGCGRSREATDFVPEMTADLVLPQHEMLNGQPIDDADQFLLSSRNDARLGNLPGNRLQTLEVVDIQHREWLRISNGRPREYTTIYTRSRKFGVAP